MSASLKMQFLCLILSWCRPNCSVVVALAFFVCDGSLDFSEAQRPTVDTTEAKGTSTIVRKTDCDLTTQCFLDETQLDSLLNCSFAPFGETYPPCYGHWTSASSCTCDDPMYRISSCGATYWCATTGIWDSTIYELKCQAPCITDADENAIPRNSNGTVSITILHGDYVIYSCPEGYTGSGTQKVDCKDGTWEPHQQFTCTEKINNEGSTSSTKITTTPDKMATIPTTITEYGTSDAEESLVSKEPTTATAASTALSSETFTSPIILKNATTPDGTTRQMDATTSKNVSVPSMDTKTYISRTTETTTAEYATLLDTTIPTSTPVNSVAFDSTASGSKILTNVVTPGDATNEQTTNPLKTQPSTKSSYITTDSYKACSFERIYFSGVELTFPTERSNTSAYSVELCGVDSTHANTSLGKRNCADGTWDEPILFQCYSRQEVTEAIEKIANASITTENVEKVASELAFLTSQTDDLLTSDVDKVADTLEKIVQTRSSSPKVTQSVVGIVNNLMEVDKADLDDKGNAQTFIVSLERQISNFQKNSKNFTEVQSNVGVNAVKVDPSLTKAITFITVISGERNVSELLNTDLSAENTLLLNDVEEVKRKSSTSSIFLPQKVLQLAKVGNPDLDKLPISFFIYKDSRLFQASSNRKEDANSATGEEIVSQVIAAKVEIENISIANLSAEDAIITRFLAKNFAKNSTTSMERRCVFWKVNEEDEKAGSWSTEGCEMISESSDNSQTVCRCSHLTSFAVIFRFESTTYTQIAFLDVITKVGTSLSVIGLTACILTLTLIKKSRQKQPTKIHINLYLCLIGFYVTFLAGDLVKGSKQHCKILSSATHYFCLATVAWTCAEAVNMYVLIVQHARTKIKYFVLVSCILCYGLPLIPTIIVFILDGTNLENYCFLHPGNFLYFGLLLEILVTLVFNIVLFSLIVQRVLCRPILSSDRQKRNESIIRIEHFVLFWILLGLSWTSGFLLIIPIWPSITVTVEILFFIFASLHGLILLVFTCVKNPDVHKIFKGTKCSFMKSGSYRMKNRKGSYSVSDLHSKMEPANARMESLFSNHAMSEERELSIFEEDFTYPTTSLANSREEDHELSSERESEDKANPSVKENNQFHQEEIMLEQDRAPVPRERFRQNNTQRKSQKGTEKQKKKVIFV